jgi:hypothetical protein
VIWGKGDEAERRWRVINLTLIIRAHVPHSNAGQWMSYAELTDEEKKLVWRYVELWRRFRRLPDGYRSFSKLEDDLAQGCGMLLCGLRIETQASHVITADVKDPNFHAAIFGRDNSAVPEMMSEELNQARRYIIQGEGPAPIRWWWAKPPLPGPKVHLVGT